MSTWFVADTSVFVIFHYLFSSQHESSAKEVKCLKRQLEEDCGVGAPKELPLSDLNLDGKEWNFEFFDDARQDETLFGLIRLGES
jgi:hypothetical protein